MSIRSTASTEARVVPEGVIFEITLRQGERFDISCLSARDHDSSAVGLQELHDQIQRSVNRLYPRGARPASRDVHLLLFDERPG